MLIELKGHLLLGGDVDKRVGVHTACWFFNVKKQNKATTKSPDYKLVQKQKKQQHGSCFLSLAHPGKGPFWVCCSPGWFFVPLSGGT